MPKAEVGKFTVRIALDTIGPNIVDDFLNLMKFANQLKPAYKQKVYARFIGNDYEIKKRFELFLYVK